MIQRSPRSTTILALTLAASLSAAPGCLWKHKDKNGAQTKPSMSSSKSMPGDPAEEQFEKGASRTPTPKTLYALAQILETQGKDEQAEGVLRRIITDEPRYMPAYCDLAELRLRQRRIEDAYNVLSAGLKISPNEAILLNDRGMCQVLLKDYDGALANFTRATSLTPDDARYRSNMAMALAMLGRYDESFSLYTLVMPSSEARQNLAVLADARGDNERAEEFRHGKMSKHAAAPSLAPVIASAPAPAPAVVALRAPATAPAVVAIHAPATAPAIVAIHAPATAPAIVAIRAPATAPTIVAIRAPATAPTIVAIRAPATAPTIIANGAPGTAPTIVTRPAPAPVAPPMPAEESEQDDENPT